VQYYVLEERSEIWHIICFKFEALDSELGSLKCYRNGLVDPNSDGVLDIRHGRPVAPLRYSAYERTVQGTALSTHLFRRRMIDLEVRKGLSP